MTSGWAAAPFDAAARLTVVVLDNTDDRFFQAAVPDNPFIADAIAPTLNASIHLQATLCDGMLARRGRV